MAEVLEARIQNLLEQRKELSERLANLESMKDETNSRVYARIRKDYDAQLDQVLGSIGEEKGALKAKADDLSSQIDSLEKSHQEQSDTVDELQIRARLREHDENDPAFKSRIDGARSELNRTAGELDVLRNELGELKKVLRDVEDATQFRASAAPSAKKVDHDEEVPGDSVEELDLEEDLEEAPAGDALKCPSCGHGNPAQNPFCDECGAALGEGEEEFADDFDLIDDEELDL